MTNLLKYPAAILKKNNIKSADAGSTLYAAIQKYRWVHVPATFHQIQSVFYGTYKYDVTPRYLVDDVLQPLDSDRTVTVSIDVSPFQSGKFQIGFTRGFVASQAYVNHFGNNSKVRPNKTDLIFDIHSKSGSVRITKNGQKPARITPSKISMRGWGGRRGREFWSFWTKLSPIRISCRMPLHLIWTSLLSATGAHTGQAGALFAIMQYSSASSILDAVKFVRDSNENIFSYGITDTTTSISLYKPHPKLGILVAGKGGAKILPPPIDKEPAIPGIAIHHKFVVVDFKGRNPVVYCGSSNLAFGPEQKNGDNLIEIRNLAAVTVFAIEAIRLVDHFSFIENTHQIFLQTSGAATPWYASYYDPEALHFIDRTLMISANK